MSLFRASRSPSMALCMYSCSSWAFNGRGKEDALSPSRSIRRALDTSSMNVPDSIALISSPMQTMPHRLSRFDKYFLHHAGGACFPPADTCIWKSAVL